MSGRSAAVQKNTSCAQVQEQFASLRNGEGPTLLRQRVEAHLQNCASCRALFDLQGELVEAARQGPAPLSVGRKQDILRRVHGQIEHSRSAQVAARSWWQQLLRPVPGDRPY